MNYIIVITGMQTDTQSEQTAPTKDAKKKKKKTT
jgi:hypothetical protein